MHSINIVSKQPIDLTFLKTNGPIPDKEFSSALNKSNRTLTGIDENHMFNSLPFRTVLSKEDSNKLTPPGIAYEGLT
jgi:hypothetical protein